MISRSISLRAALTIIILSLPFITSAQTPTPVPSPQAEALRLQAQALLVRVQQLQGQLGTNANAAGGVTLDSSSCPLIGRSLRRGSTGDDVTRLQQFLARDPSIYPEGKVSGLYGALTEAAVKRWQTKYNIVSSGATSVTGWGVVGPRTAAAIALLCTTGSYGGVAGPQGGAVGGYIQVTPISGNAPLNVAVQATINTVNACGGSTYILDWGDNTQPQNIVQPAGNCAQQTQTLGHTYGNGGVYQISLIAGAHRSYATVQVFGGSSSPSPSSSDISDTLTAKPRSGTAPLTVKFGGVMNAARSCDGGEYTLVYGDGQSASVPFPADSCQAFTFSNEHQYTSAGSFTAKLYRGTTSGKLVETETITINGETNTSSGPFVITPAYDGNVFHVQADFDIGSPCSAFDLDWGDGSSHVSQADGGSCTQVVTQKMYQHTYNTPGSYTLTLKRGSATDTAGIVISAP